MWALTRLLIFTSSFGCLIAAPYDVYEQKFNVSDHQVNNGGLPVIYPAEPLTPAEFDAADALDLDELERPGTKKPVTSSFETRLQARRQLAARNGLTDSTKKWSKATIPYLVSTEFDSKFRLLLAKSFKEFHKSTCIRFVPLQNQNDYIYIVNGTGCDSEAGRIGGEQTVSLGPDCHDLSTVVHELNHAVGFWHEQNRPDRDKYIKIHWDNILPENRFNFDKLSEDEVSSFGVPYDTDSIMHYDKWAFSREYGKLPVMTPHVPNSKMGLATKFSKSDIVKINKMYRCSSHKQRNDDFKSLTRVASDADECRDQFHNCAKFLENGTCPESIWIAANCRKSCNRCGSTCEDLNAECPIWAQAGKCRTELNYMRSYCPKSCQLC